MQYASDIVKYVKSKIYFFNNKNDLIEQEDYINNNVCIICTNEFKKDDEIITLSKEYDIDCECNYSYHRDCIDEWFERSRSCPLCRSIAYSRQKTFYSDYKVFVYIILLIIYILLHYFLGDVYYMQEDALDFFFP
jgi:hypothetical protein